MEWAIILGVILWLVCKILISWEFAKIADLKGYSRWKHFWWAFGFDIVGWLLVIALPDKTARGTVPQIQAQTREPSNELPDL